MSEEEQHFVRRHARGDAGRLSLAVLLKTRQRLGYFVALADVPDQIRLHLARTLGVAEQTPLVDEVGRSATVHRYRNAIRDRLVSRPFSHCGRAIVIGAVHRAAQTMSDPADLISASIEALIKEHVELPVFSALDRLVGSLRQEIHETLYAGINAALNDSQRRILDALLDQPTGVRLNAFSRLKQNPGPPTLKHLREWTDRLAELDAILDPRPFLKDIPHTKVRQFAAEAAALESGDLRDVCLPGRRHTLLLCLLYQVQSETRDQLVEMLIRRLRRTQNKAVERLHELQVNHREIEETLLNRCALEVCVFIHLAEALQSGDLFVVGSGAYADYCAQLLPWPDCHQQLADYSTAVGLPSDASDFVAELRDQLTRFAEQVDGGFPDNSALMIDADGTPHLIRQPAQRLPDGLHAFEDAVRARVPERHLLDVLKHAQHWSAFTRHFGPLSGSAEGQPVTKDLVSRLSPYIREHIRRFGQYTLDMDEQPPALHSRPLTIFREGS